MRHGLVSALCLTALLLGGCPTAADREVPSATTTNSRWTEVDGALVHYVEAGAGDEALVMVHGLACNQEFWRDQVDGLRGDIRVIAIDLPGYGASAPPKQGYTMDTFARAVARVMDHAGVRRAILAGHSFGVPVVRQFYRRYPGRTAGLILVDGALRPFFPPEEAEKTIGPYRDEGYRVAAEKWIDGMLIEAQPAALRAFIKSRMLATRQEALIGGLVAMSAPDIWKDDPITVPTMMIGADHPWWRGEYRAYADTLVPKETEWHLRSNVSHFVQLDAPVWFNDLVRDWMSRHGFPAN